MRWRRTEGRVSPSCPSRLPAPRTSIPVRTMHPRPTNAVPGEGGPGSSSCRLSRRPREGTLPRRGEEGRVGASRHEDEAGAGREAWRRRLSRLRPGSSPAPRAPYLQGADLLLGEVVGHGALGAQPAQAADGDVDELLQLPALLQRPAGRGPGAPIRRGIRTAALLLLAHRRPAQRRSIHASASGPPGGRGEEPGAGGASAGKP